MSNSCASNVGVEYSPLPEAEISKISYGHIDRSAELIQSFSGWFSRLFNDELPPNLRIIMPLATDENIAGIRADLAARMTRLPDDVQLIMRTSGSTTGNGRLIGLSGAQLTASIRATDERLGGPATWLLALPPHHIAGLQVIARSVWNGKQPHIIDYLDAENLTRAIAQVRSKNPAARINLSVVPTQLADLIDDEPALDALRQLNNVLVGGAPTSPNLFARAIVAGVPLHTTYGMSETCGGCVYDGMPLQGVRIGLGETPDTHASQGRIWLSGPMLMSGYLDGDSGITTIDGMRWLATNDLGRIVDGKLQIIGRIDDVIISGGLKITAADVRNAALTHPDVRDIAMTGLPDERWGQIVAALVVPQDSWSTESFVSLRDHVGALIGREKAPRLISPTSELPQLASGKLDRIAVKQILADAQKNGSAWIAR